MDRNKIYFTSDAHLGSAYHPNPINVERCIVRWLDEIAPTAKAIYFLGDMFDYWFEYRYVIPKGYVRFLGKLASLSDDGIELHFFTGNHDTWLGNYLKQELNAQIHTESKVVELNNKKFRLSHGDEEYRSVSKANNFLYLLFRNKLARTLFAAIHPRWTVGFALSWSLSSRKKGLRKKGGVPHTIHNEYFDIEQEHLVKITKQYIQEKEEIDFYLYGHRHLMLDLMLKDKKRMLILGDWITYNSYAVWDGEHLVLQQFEIE